jgi:hypothetical protein
MSRHERRARAKEAGIDWRAAQQAKRHADRIESGVLRMSPAKARELLAMWAAIPGRSQEEVDAMNSLEPLGDKYS